LTISIRSNSASLRAQRILSRTSDQLSSVFARLSSGDRINRASDDAGGLAISESLKLKSKVAAAAIRNTNDGLSGLNIADAALGEISNILGRMSELAEQSANGTLSSSQRLILNKEFRALGEEISRVAEATTFNGRELLIQRPSGGTPPVVELDGDAIGFDINHVASQTLYSTFSSNSITLQVGFTSAAQSQITTTSINASLTGLGLGNYYVVQPPTGSELPEREYLDQNIRNVNEARTSLTLLSTAITQVSTYRGQIGATQARLDVAVGSLGVAYENFVAANSRIRSADYATEAAQLTRLSIAQNAGTAVLAQANQQPALALTLLRS
jgi:flagellin